MLPDEDYSLEDIIAGLDSLPSIADKTDSLRKYLSDVVEYDIDNNIVTPLDEAIYAVGQAIHSSLQENQTEYGFNYDFARQLTGAPSLQVLDSIRIQYDEDFVVASVHVELDAAYITFDEIAPMSTDNIYNRLLRLCYDFIASDFGLINSTLAEFMQTFVAAEKTATSTTNEAAQHTDEDWRGELVTVAGDSGQGPRNKENDSVRQYELKTFCKRWSCGEDEPRRCYKHAALRLHPDRNGGAATATAKFQTLGNDFDELCGQGALDCSLPCPDASGHWLPEELNEKFPRGDRNTEHDEGTEGQEEATSDFPRGDRNTEHDEGTEGQEEVTSDEKWMRDTTKDVPCHIPSHMRDAIHTKLEQIANHLSPYCIAAPHTIRIYHTDTFDVLYVWCQQGDTAQTVTSWVDILLTHTCSQIVI